MAITDSLERRARDRAILYALGALAAVGLAIALWGFWPPPQMGPDPDVFASVDALFTAVTSKDARRLDDCEHRLRDYRDAGKLPTAAAACLDAIIREARLGSWEAAAKRLYDFMKGQRREGRIEHGSRPNEKTRAAAVR